MKPIHHPYVKLGLFSGLLIVGVIAALNMRQFPPQAAAQTPADVPKAVASSPAGGTTNATPASPTNSAVAVTNIMAEATNAPPGVATNAPGRTPPSVRTSTSPMPSGAMPMMPGGAPGMMGGGGPAPMEPDNFGPNDEIQLSFQGANIDMIVQWMAKATGKSVVKHPRAQCQLTIVSSKKLPVKEALNLVYRALALEGFTTIETTKSIMVVPEGQEPKLSPEFLQPTQDAIPDGRQKMVKIFSLTNAQAAELREKVRPVLSEKASVEVAERGNQLMITDYTDNLRLVTEVIKTLDVPSASETAIEFFKLKYSEAEELGTLLSLILNSQPAPPSPPSMPMRSSSSMSRPPGMPEMMMSSPQPPPSMPSGGQPGQQPSGPQAIRIWPDKVSNRLIVGAPKSKMAEVKRLIDTLDTEKPQDVALRVIPLRNASAEDLVREIGPLYQRMSGRSIKDVIEVAANTRGNSLVVLSSESNFKMIEKLVASLDTDEAQEKAMKAYPLKNGDAEDVAKQLRDLNQDQGQSRYPFYIFSYSSMGGRGANKSVNVVADRRRNTVIVQAPPAMMETIEKLIEALDEPVTDNSLAPKVYRLKYVSASDIEEVLNELFLKKQQQRYYWDYYEEMYGGGGGNQDKQAGRLYGKVRITSEPYSNTLIITANSDEALKAVEEIIKELDVPSQAGESTMRVNLKFAKAQQVANSINILFAKGGSPPLRQTPQQGPQNDNRPGQQNQSSTQSNFSLEQEQKDDGYFPWLGGQPENSYRGYDGRNTTQPVSDLVGRVRVVADRRSNSLLVSCKVHFFPQVIKLIEELDAPTPQVLIEAKIIEVSSDFRERMGVRWSPDGSRSFDQDDQDNSIAIDTKTSYREVFAGTPLAGALRTGVLESSVNLDILIQFLRKNTESKVLAEPLINIADNEMGKLFVGSQVPFIDRTLSTDVGGLNQSFSYKDVGIILEVTPHINEAEEVALRIRAESSNIRSGETLFGGAILDTRNFRTDLVVKSGQTIVLGGILQQAQGNTLRKTPVLGSIPGLGWLFKKRDNVSREVELMVFLKPRVIRNGEMAKTVTEEVIDKAPLLKEWDRTTPPPGTDPEKKKKKMK